MHSAGVSLSPFHDSFSSPLTRRVVKNSLDAVCIAFSRMSPLKADRVGNGGFPQAGGDLWSSWFVCSGTLRGFDVCIRLKVLQISLEFDGDTRVAECLTRNCDPCEFNCPHCRATTLEEHSTAIYSIIQAALSHAVLYVQIMDGWMEIIDDRMVNI